MYKTKENIGKRFFIGAVLAAFILFPIFVALVHQHSLSVKNSERLRILVKDELLSELGEFKEDTNPRRYLENIFKKMEEDLGLTFSGNVSPAAKNGVDPEIYSENILERINEYLVQKHGIKPLIIVSHGYNLKNLSSYFDPVFNIGNNDQKLLTNLFGVSLAFDLASKNDGEWLLEFVKKMQMTYEEARDDKRVVIEKLFHKYISVLGKYSSERGICEEVFTSKFGNEKLYIFSDGLNQAGSSNIFGGFFILVSDLSVKSEKILKNAVISRNKSIKREIVYSENESRSNQVNDKGWIKISGNCSAEFYGHFSNEVRNLDLPKIRNLKNISLKVSADLNDFASTFEETFVNFGFLARLFILFLLTGLFHFAFFGFPYDPGLRRKILLLTGVILLLPYALIGYSSKLLFENMDQLRKREIQIDGESRLFEVSQFVKDLRIRRVLNGLKAKISTIKERENIRAGHMSEKGRGFFKEAILGQLKLFYKDGYFCEITNSFITYEEIKQLFILMSAKYLDSMGILDKSKIENQKNLRKASYTDGFIDGLTRDYFEGRQMRNEGVETQNITTLEGLSKMLFFLIPESMNENVSIDAIGFIQLSNFRDIGNIFLELAINKGFLLEEIEPFKTYRFALGTRKSEDFILNIAPENSYSKTFLKPLLNKAVRTQSSGSISSRFGDKRTLHSWKFIKEDAIVIAGIVEAVQDQVLRFCIQALPFVFAVISLLSLVLIGEAIYILLVKPVSVFITGVKQIGLGDFQTTIEIEKSDEFSDLAKSFNEMSSGLLQKEKMKRFVSDKLLERVEKGHQDTISKETAEEYDLSVLSSDIRDFTSITEKNDAQEIVSLLNDYFTEMEQAIIINGGIIDRFIGDAVSAVFYADDESEHHAFRAVKAAIEMRERIKMINLARSKAGKFEIENGIGISTGRAIIGVAGSERGRKVFTVLGEITKKADILESKTKLSNSKVVICEKTMNFVEGNFEFKRLAEDDESFELIF